MATHSGGRGVSLNVFKSHFSLILLRLLMSFQKPCNVCTVDLKMVSGWSCFKLSFPHYQVYEQLYDTLDIVGGPEVRAQATAKVSIYIY